MGEARRLVDFDDDADFAAWQPIDDVVMGGVSRSTFSRRRMASPASAAWSRSNYGGGFASVRTKPQAWATGGAESFMLRCRGDGRQYKFTVRTDDGFDGVQYQARFAPPAGRMDDGRHAGDGVCRDLSRTPGARCCSRSIRRVFASSG